MYFTARTFYFRISVVLWLPVTDWLVCTLGDRDVALIRSLEFTPRCLQCATG